MAAQKRVKPVLYTIGHSTRSLAEFKELLRVFEIKTVIDIRSIPKSRHNPQFSAARLKRSLEAGGLGYVWIERLGGLRHARKDSINLGWRNVSFRGYADYMATPEFADGLKKLMRLAQKKPTAITCAEAVPWRCHRSLIADALGKQGWSVRHIISKTSAPPHRFTPFLKMRHGILT
ncbi:MAG: DUF488 family protein, partial [Minisyncoccia bacterium]